MIASLFLTLHLLFSSSVLHQINQIGAEIWFEYITPDYDNEMSHYYELTSKPEKLPYKDVHSYSEKQYSGNYDQINGYDTVRLSNFSSKKVFFNKYGFKERINYYASRNTLYSIDSFFYDNPANGRLTSMIRSYNKSNSNYKWNIEYDTNGLVKKQTLRKLNGRLIAEREFEYIPDERKIISKITYGKDNVLKQDIYRYDKKGHLTTIERMANLTKSTGLTTYQYEKGKLVLEKTSWIDSTGKKVEEIVNQYVDNLLIEHSFFLKRWGGKVPQTTHYEYSKNGELNKEVFEFGDGPTTKLYSYKFDEKKREQWVIYTSQQALNSLRLHITIKHFELKNTAK